MTIDRIVATPVAIKDPPLLNAAGLHAPYALRIIIEITTDNRITGISEIPGGADLLATIETVKNHLLGVDPFHLSTIKAILQHSLVKDLTGEKRGVQPWDQRKAVHIFSAIEVACLDLIGKSVNRPVHDILGGALRKSVPFAGYLFYKYRGAGGELGFETVDGRTGWESARQEEALSPGEIVDQAKAMCEKYGFRSLKLKGGVFEPEFEIETVIQLRKAFGDEIPVRIDPNGVWSLDTALESAKALKGVVEYLEDPVRGQENMAALRKKIDIPLATNMCTTSFAELESSIRSGSEDIILTDHHYWGGLHDSLILARLAEHIDRSVSVHSNSHLGISLTAMVHLGAVMPHLPYALDTHYPWQTEEVVTGGSITFENGIVKVPGGPGLGVELDHDALESLHKNYLACGLRERDDAAEMKKVDPSWRFMETRY